MSMEKERPVTPVTVSHSDPMLIIAGIRQFGLAPDGSDLRDLEAALSVRTQAEPVAWLWRWSENEPWSIAGHEPKMAKFKKPLYAVPAPEEAIIVVKPLAWEQPDGDNATPLSCWLGHGIEMCQYYIGYDDGVWWMPFDHDEAEPFDTIDAAKAAAQADFEAHIRSALSTGGKP